MSILDFTFNNTHFQVKMVKKFKIYFFLDFSMWVTTLSKKSRPIDLTRFHWIWRQKVFFVIFVSRQEYVLKMKHLEFLTRHYSGASV